VSAPAFTKNPKVIISTIVVVWIAYILYWDYRHLTPIRIKLLPFKGPYNVNVSSVMAVSAIFGIIATIVVQYFWRRGRRSKDGSVSATTAGSSSKTVA